MQNLQHLFFGPLASQNKVLLFVIAAWALVWKGLSLWRSARHGQRNWFIALLVLNTLGILDILYLAVFQTKHSANTSTKEKNKVSQK